MSKKKTKQTSKSKKKKTSKKIVNKVCTEEKAYGDPTPVKPLRPVTDYYNAQTGEIYPKVVFNDTLWVKFKRFFGLV